MFHTNLIQLRKLHRMTQEELAEKLGVSRQTISKWETGESVPDILQCGQLGEIFNVSTDDLINHKSSEDPLPMPPKGKYLFGVVRVGDKGQIVIPARARAVFDIKPGDDLIVLGDESQGLGLMKAQDFQRMADVLRAMKPELP